MEICGLHLVDIWKQKQPDYIVDRPLQKGRQQLWNGNLPNSQWVKKCAFGNFKAKKRHGKHWKRIKFVHAPVVIHSKHKWSTYINHHIIQNGMLPLRIPHWQNAFKKRMMWVCHCGTITWSYNGTPHIQYTGRMNGKGTLSWCGSHYLKDPKSPCRNGVSSIECHDMDGNVGLA